jgi:hypothetical protein
MTSGPSGNLEVTLQEEGSGQIFLIDDCKENIRERSRSE